MARQMKYISRDDALKQHAISQLLKPVQEYQLRQKFLYKDWDNQLEYRGNAPNRFS